MTSFNQTTRIAKAQQINPYQTQIEFVFTDFLPNKNNQGIPLDEADNIISSAVGMPIKVNLSNRRHENAIPIGPIQAVWRSEDGSRDVLLARATIWDSEFPEVAMFLRSAYAEQKDIGTSWELRYSESENLDGVEWLKGIIVTGTAIVDNPAYGKTRTRVLAIAEVENNMEEKIKELEEKVSELTAALTTKVEAESAVKSELDTSKSALAELQSKLDATESDLTFTRRSHVLGSVFSVEELAAKRSFILGMTNEAFAEYTSDLARVAKAENKVSSAEVKIPNFIAPAEMTIDDLVKKLKEVK
jgi:DNA-binding Lrp family transcriptional regulator